MTKYKNTNTQEEARVWTRSPSVSTSTYWCLSRAGSNPVGGEDKMTYSNGFAPAFCV